MLGTFSVVDEKVDVDSDDDDDSEGSLKPDNCKPNQVEDIINEDCKLSFIVWNGRKYTVF